MSIALVSGQSVTASGEGQQTAAHFNNAITAGNAIVVAAIVNSSTQGLYRVTDSGNTNVYTKQGTTYLANGMALEVWACLNAVSTGSPNQALTATPYSSTQYLGIIGQEISGLAHSGAFDVQAGTNTTSGTSLPTSVTTTQTSEILLAVGGQTSSTRPFTAGTGFTMINQNEGSSNAGLSLAYQLVSSPGSYSANMTIDISESWNLALFGLGVGGTTSTPTGLFFNFF